MNTLNGQDELASYLGALERADGYQVDCVLKQGAVETTERVHYVDGNGAEGGPCIRKRFPRDAGMGKAYGRLYAATRAGERFEHIPQVYECYQDERESVVVMEYVDGESLEHLVSRRGAGPELAASLFSGLCDAVLELQTRFDPPIIHRDLKPGNIVVRSGVPVLIDFGIAREYDETASTDTTHFGTRAYAPPEQYGYGQTTVRSDVYALGLLLYFLLTGRDPSPNVVQGGFADAPISPQMLQVIRHATAFDPRQRYGDALELREAFEAAVAAGPSHLARGGAGGRSGAYAGSAGEAAADARRFASGGTGAGGRRGLVRNIVLLICYLIFLAACIHDIVNPGVSGDDYGLAGNLLMYGLCCPLLVGGFFFIAMDRRHLRERHAWARRIRPEHDKWVATILIVLPFLIFTFYDG